VLKVKELVVVLALFGVALVLGASLFESMVMAPNFQSGAQALDHARQFMVAANPGTFFRVVVPLTQILLLLSVILLWRSSRRRWPLLLAFLLMVIADVITFTFHHPRNAVLFGSPLTVDPELLAATAREWAWGNHVRVLLTAVAFALALYAFRWGAAHVPGDGRSPQAM